MTQSSPPIIPSPPKRLRCAIYTRKSCEEGLEQDFNSLHAQREAAEHYINSQAHEGWEIISTQYDDGGFSGGNTKRPALQQLLEDIKQQKIDIVVVYKVDRLSRSLIDFSQLMQQFEQQKVSFVSVTQSFNTTNSMGRLTLNMLLSFAQFEREVTSERIRDKIAASKAKGMWMGGRVPLGYKVIDRKLEVVESGAEIVRKLFNDYASGEYTMYSLADKYHFTKGKIEKLLHNHYYIGKVPFKDEIYNGQHQAIIEKELFNKVQGILLTRTKNQERHKQLKQPRKTKYETVNKDYLLRLKLEDASGVSYSIATVAKKTSDGNSHYFRYYAQSKHSNKILRHINAVMLEKYIIEQISFQLSLLSPEILQLKLCSEIIFKNRIDAFIQTTKANNNHSALKEILTKVVIAEDQMSIYLNNSILARHLFEDYCAASKDKIITNGHNDDEMIERTVDIKMASLKKGKKQIYSPKGNIINNAKTSFTVKDPILIQYLKKAFKWEQQMSKDPSLTFQQIAKQENSHFSNMSRIAKLRFLSPIIIEQILAGTQPENMTMEMLKKPFPMDWKEQLKHFAITA